MFNLPPPESAYVIYEWYLASAIRSSSESRYEVNWAEVRVLASSIANEAEKKRVIVFRSLCLLINWINEKGVRHYNRSTCLIKQT